VFVFAGRRPNLEIQMPFLRRILDDHPDVEVHLWDLCRTKEDSRYLRTLHGDRVQVKTSFRIHGQSNGIRNVWDHYALPEYKDCVFVKCDDDDLFIETDAFDSFVQAAVDNSDSVISALTINNGASTMLLPEVWRGFEQLGIPLLDVHLSAQYAELCHRWFFDNWRNVIGRPAKLTPADTWVSINCLAYTYETGCRISAQIGQQSPVMIADREFPRLNADGRMSGHHVGDEGAANMLKILIHEGMTVGHFSFGPQDRLMDESLQTELRKNYADISRQYLA
jgi:hypothetical protein